MVNLLPFLITTVIITYSLKVDNDVDAKKCINYIVILNFTEISHDISDTNRFLKHLIPDSFFSDF